MNTTECFLLGPQRPTPNLGDPFREFEPRGPVAIVSAGWQEAEGDVDDVQAIVGHELVDLQLYRRAETVFEEDPALHARYRERQDLLIELQRLHRLRLRQALRATRELLRADTDASLLAEERRHAVAQLRALDRHHLNRIESLYDESADAIEASDSKPRTHHVAEVARVLEASDTVIVTGGNVAILVNRLRLFGLDTLLAGKRIIAWSAGAMALTERIVLYHDHTPLRTRDAELLGAGLAYVPGVVLLPDARHRLRRSDRVRVSLMSRRFAPAECVTLNNGAMLHFVGDRLVGSREAKGLTREGSLRTVRAA